MESALRQNYINCRNISHKAERDFNNKTIEDMVFHELLPQNVHPSNKVLHFAPSYNHSNQHEMGLIIVQNKKNPTTMFFLLVMKS